jgi:hypothetical protein
VEVRDLRVPPTRWAAAGSGEKRGRADAWDAAAKRGAIRLLAWLSISAGEEMQRPLRQGRPQAGSSEPVPATNKWKE